MREVLLVDDDPTLLEVLATVLDLEEFTVRTASGGRQALEAVAARAPDIVVCDVMMPELDGLGVCQAVKGAHGASIPVVLLTGRGDAEVEVQGAQVGCDAVLAKPFSALALVDLVRRLTGVTPAGQRPGDAASAASPSPNSEA